MPETTSTVETIQTQRQRNAQGQFLPIRIKSSNEAGLGGTITVRVPIEFIRRISELSVEAVAKGRYPWKTKGDVIRWLLAGGFEHLANTEGERDEFVATYRAGKIADDIETERLTAQRLYDKISTEIEQLLLVNIDDAERIFQAFLAQVFDMPDTAWRNHLIDRLKDKFPGLLKRPAVASLMHRRLREHVLPRAKAEAVKTSKKPKRVSKRAPFRLHFGKKR